MKRFNMITPEGTKDSLFQECIVRREVEAQLKGVFCSRGYNEVITPGLEYYDVFDLEGAAIPQFEMYKSCDNKGRLVVFRPDLTLPIARLTATRLKNLEAPVRLYYNQPVYRNRPDLTGRSDESTQAGIELMGASGLRADLEAIVTAIEALESCHVNFRLEIGHGGLFPILAEKLSVSAEMEESIRRTIESKNYAALNGILDQLEASPYRDAIKSLPRLFGGEEVFAAAGTLCEGEREKEVLSYLESLYKALCKLGLGDRIIVDLGLVQRNDYYTGVVFSAYVEGHGAAVLMGGRYDTLLEKFNSPMPAVGFGVDVDAVAEILLKKKNTNTVVPDILVFSHTGYEIEGQMKIASLTKEGLICENALQACPDEARAYGKRRGMKRLMIVGATEEEEKL